MEFKNIEEAKSAYFEGHKIYRKASKVGDVKTSNKIITSQMNPAIEYLKEQNELKTLIPFLEQDDDINLKQAIAVVLLPHYEDICVNVLEDIVKRNISNSFTAGMVLEQWRKGLH